MSKYRIKPFTPQDIKTYSLQSRKSKVNIHKFAQAVAPDEKYSRFVDSLPDILAGKNFKEFISLMGKAKKQNKGIIWALGAHVIKVGLNPVIIDLMKEGWVTSLAINGAVIIHDFEVAFAGQTSEDVESQLKDGRFGMAQETAEVLNEAVNQGEGREAGLGETLGESLSKSNYPYKNMSLLAAAYDLNIPVTVHVAIGTDIIHFHPKARGEAFGKLSHRDFFLFCSLLKRLEGGGVFLNVGSAVILPEVFLKALSLVRNKGSLLKGFTTAVFDFIHHYRPHQNVVKRPHGETGKGFYFIGHHELLIPLLAASLKSSESGK